MGNKIDDASVAALRQVLPSLVGKSNVDQLTKVPHLFKGNSAFNAILIEDLDAPTWDLTGDVETDATIDITPTTAKYRRIIYDVENEEYKLGVERTAYNVTPNVSFSKEDVVIITRVSGRDRVSVAAPRFALAKSDGAISKGSWASVSLWTGELGLETDNTENVTALNIFGDVDIAGLWLFLVWIHGGWLILQAECA